MNPPRCLNGHPMRRDRRYTKADLWKCRECEMTVLTEPGFYRDPSRDPVRRECACGCGETFEPGLRHPRQRFVDATHRQRAHRARKRGSPP